MSDEQVCDHLSLEQIEDDRWGEPPADATRLIATVHHLRHKPIRSLTAEDLRLLVAQRVGLNVLVPQALARLKQDPLLEGDFYPGDVLVAVLKVPHSYWLAHPNLQDQAEQIASAITPPTAQLQADIDAFLTQTRK